MKNILIVLSVLLLSCGSPFDIFGPMEPINDVKCSAKSGKYPNGLKCYLYQTGYNWEDPSVIFYGHNDGREPTRLLIHDSIAVIKDTIGWCGCCTCDPWSSDYSCIPIISKRDSLISRDTLGWYQIDAFRPTIMFHEDSDEFYFRPGEYWIIRAQAQFMPGQMAASPERKWIFDCR